MGTNALHAELCTNMAVSRPEKERFDSSSVVCSCYNETGGRKNRKGLMKESNMGVQRLAYMSLSTPHPAVPPPPPQYTCPGSRETTVGILH